jgi:hypothetical protein
MQLRKETDRFIVDVQLLRECPHPQAVVTASQENHVVAQVVEMRS